MTDAPETTGMPRAAMSRRELLKFTAATGLVLAAAGTMGGRALAQKAGTLRIGLNARDMGVLHPHVATGGNDVPIVAAVYSGLVRYSPTAVSIDAIEPDLAESWENSDDFKTWTFHLREGAKWHKGYGDVTSEDVAYSLAWVRDNEQSTFKPLYGNIANIETPDPLTVVITLENPDPTFVTSVANWQGGFVICKKAAEEMGDTYRTEPVGSGPFMFESYSPNENVTLVAFPDYYGGKPALDEVIFSYVPDTTARRFAFVQQELDVIQGASNNDWLTEVVSATPGGAKIDLLGPVRNVCMHMKRSVAPLDNLDVRKAIAHAINREDFEQYFGRVFSATWSLIPPSYFGGLEKTDLPEEVVYDFDPAKSQELLAAAGYPDGFEIETVVSERSDYLAIAQIVQERLANVGITLKLNVLDHGSWVAAIIKEKRGSLVWSISSRFPSAEYLMREFWISAANVTEPTGVQGFAEWGNPEFDKAYEAAISTADPAQRLEDFKKAQLIAMAELPTIPLGAMSTPVLRQGYVDLGYTVPEDDVIVSLPYFYQLATGAKV